MPSAPGSTSFSWDKRTVTCIACGQDVEDTRFNIQIHQQAHKDAEERAIKWERDHAGRLERAERDAATLRQLAAVLDKVLDAT